MVRQRTNRRPCQFCEQGINPYFGDISQLEKYLSERGKIVGRKRTGVCAKHQRRLSRAIKRARFLSLLPFSEHLL